jgi:hypothetical protein
MRFPRWRVIALVVGLLAPSSARALQLGDPDSLLSIDVHAFASQGFILTSKNNYLDNDTTHGSFQFSELGLNFTKDLTDRLRLGLQLFAQDIGPTGNYNVSLDWFYVDYRWKDWLGLRVGRVKIPFGLYNEVNDIDSARLPVLLPQSVYPLENSHYLLAQTGGELYGYLRLGRAGALDYHAYAGTIFIDTSTLLSSTSPFELGSFNVPYLAGGRLMWETPLEGLRVGGSAQALRLDVTLVQGGASTAIQVPVALWVASAEYSAHDVLLAAEYSRWYVTDNSNNPTLFPNRPQVVSERAYGMAAYRESKWLQTGAYFSMLFPDVTEREGPAGRQNDLAATVRFDINPFWLVKLEGHYMFGTAGLVSSLNDNLPLTSLQEHWGVLLLKTTAYF